GEGLQPVPSPERDRRRVVDDAVARLKAAQWRALAVTHLHEAEGAAAPRMIPRRDRDPELAHDATGANTRSRWPSGSSATKEWPGWEASVSPWLRRAPYVAMMTVSVSSEQSHLFRNSFPIAPGAHQRAAPLRVAPAGQAQLGDAVGAEVAVVAAHLAPGGEH